MSRNRLGSVKASVAEHEQMNSLWHSLIDTLRLLPSIPTNPSSLKISFGLTDTERERDLRILQSEKKHLDEALDKLNVLLALRRGSSVPPDTNSNSNSNSTSIPGVIISNIKGEISTPNSTSSGGIIKRKRKLSLSASASPVPPNLDYQSPAQGSGGKNASGITMSREITGKQRRELYFDQLPLLPGRKVAFKLPKQKSETNQNDNSDQYNALGGGGDDWILATIKKCIQQDKMRYEVQDVDDGNAYNTTLRSIIPLPDPNSSIHLSSHPNNLEDFPRDSQVLALYPDTTSFYRATVISPPLPGTGHGHGLSSSLFNNNKNGKNDSNYQYHYAGAKKGVYRLVFVDDDNNISEVGKDYVVAFPN